MTEITEVKEALSAYKEVVKKLSQEQLSKGLTGELKQSLNGKLTSLREKAILMEAMLAGKQQKCEEVGKKIAEEEGKAGCGIVTALEAEVTMLKRCLRMPEAITGMPADSFPEEIQKLPPRKRILTELKQGIAKKAKLSGELQALVGMRVISAPAISQEARSKVRAMNAASSGLMSLPELGYKPTKPSKAEPADLTETPLELSIACANLVALSNAAKGCDLSGVTVNSASELCFNMEGVKFSVRKNKTTGRLAARTEPYVNLHHLLPGANLDESDACGAAGEYIEYLWLDSLTGVPRWTQRRFTGNSVQLGAPARVHGILRCNTPLDSVFALILARMNVFKEVEAGFEAFKADGGTVVSHEGGLSFLSYTLSKDGASYAVIHPLQNTSKPLVAATSPAAPQHTPTTTDPYLYSFSESPVSGFNYATGAAPCSSQPSSASDIFSSIQANVKTEPPASPKPVDACWTSAGVLERTWCAKKSCWVLAYKE
eukprot:TRINITY_DN36949_c0_g1_i1.p1 TRINITY_DN36949_c0_g1~~TRINITY_DN36949_c0_g1_i1.p1  ORF type:complete len:512 (+),score=105.07 TRINITY_DN36949_c0_g1_i1:77-1537(+)